MRRSTGFLNIAIVWRGRSGSAACTFLVLAIQRSPDFAERLGLAFQMTNIIRDVSGDFEMGRVYLPQEDLDRFGVAREELRGPVTPKLRELLEFEADRAWRLYEEGAALVQQVDADSRATLWALVGPIAVCWRESKSADSTCFRRAFRFECRKTSISTDGQDDRPVENGCPRKAFW